MSTNPIIPVLDLAHGQAVHAVAGRRAEYLPVESVLTSGSRGDPLALAQAYREQLRAAECYVADLDSIQGGAPQLELLRRLADPVNGFGPGLLVDAGAPGITAVNQLLELGAARVIAGLESLRDWSDLGRMVGATDPDRCWFSLDLRSGEPLFRADASDHMRRQSAEALVDTALAAGVGGLLVIDLASVGSRHGPPMMPLLARISACCGVPIYAGGGVRGKGDVEALLRAGATGVLVGTAVHEGIEGLRD